MGTPCEHAQYRCGEPRGPLTVTMWMFAKKKKNSEFVEIQGFVQYDIF